MSLRSLALDWTIDGPAAALLAQLALIGSFYLAAVARGNRSARPARRWPKQRTGFFLSGLAVAAIDVTSSIGTHADTRLSAHMLEHMILWVMSRHCSPQAPPSGSPSIRSDGQAADGSLDACGRARYPR